MAVQANRRDAGPAGMIALLLASGVLGRPGPGAPGAARPAAYAPIDVGPWSTRHRRRAPTRSTPSRLSRSATASSRSPSMPRGCRCSRRRSNRRPRSVPCRTGAGTRRPTPNGSIGDVPPREFNSYGRPVGYADIPATSPRPRSRGCAPTRTASTWADRVPPEEGVTARAPARRTCRTSTRCWISGTGSSSAASLFDGQDVRRANRRATRPCDAIAVQVSSPLVSQRGRLADRDRIPVRHWSDAVTADWKHPEAHSTIRTAMGEAGARVGSRERSMAIPTWSMPRGSRRRLPMSHAEARHRFVLSASGSEETTGTRRGVRAGRDARRDRAAGAL